MRIAVDIGHNCPYDNGAVGIGNENTLNMSVGNSLIAKLTRLGHTVMCVTPSTAINLTDALQRRVDASNNFGADLYVSIHFNAGGGKGTEVYAMSESGRTYAQRVVNEIAALGYVNRGVKDGSGLYVLRNTNAVAILVECAFVDSSEDMAMINPERTANAIAKGITGQDASEPAYQLPEGFNEEYYLWRYPDIAAAVANGSIPSGGYHYAYYGINEGREYKPTLPQDFTEAGYLACNDDIRIAVETGAIPSGAWHWLTQGWKEGRSYIPSTPTTPTPPVKVAIMGNCIATSEQLATFLLKTNAVPKLMGMNVLDFCSLYLEEGASEGVKGDIAFCQSIHETGWLVFTGDVVPEQMNYAGIGTVGGGVKGHYFGSQREGVRAQIQHLKAYASAAPLVNECVDPRYGLVTKGVAPNWEDLGGKWAVPGYSRTKYSSFDEAYTAGETYGQLILKLYNRLINTVVDEALIAPYKRLYTVSVTFNYEASANTCKLLLEQNGYTPEVSVS